MTESGRARFKPTVVFHGPVATHDMPCAVYGELPAVLDCNSGIFEPSWSAQADGYVLIRVRSEWLRDFIKRLFPPSKVGHRVTDHNLNSEPRP